MGWLTIGSSVGRFRVVWGELALTEAASSVLDIAVESSVTVALRRRNRRTHWFERRRPWLPRFRRCAQFQGLLLRHSREVLRNTLFRLIIILRNIILLYHRHLSLLICVLILA